MITEAMEGHIKAMIFNPLTDEDRLVTEAINILDVARKKKIGYVVMVSLQVPKEFFLKKNNFLQVDMVHLSKDLKVLLLLFPNLKKSKIILQSLTNTVNGLSFVFPLFNNTCTFGPKWLKAKP
jgi:hypothetical protein